MADMVYTGSLTIESCWCGIVYAIPAELGQHMRNCFRDGRPQPKVSCPLGHTWEFAGEGEAAKLRRQLEREQARLAAERAEHDQTRASLRATKAVVTRQKRRAAAGVCPCCHRTFKQVAAHMKRQHPEYVAEAAAE